MFSEYARDEDRAGGATGGGGEYPWRHIHPTARGHTVPYQSSPTRTSKSLKSALSGPGEPPPQVRGLAGPRTKQEVGYGPFHIVREDARRFDFSKPKNDMNRPLSQINVPQSSYEEEDENVNPIKLFHGNYEENAQRHRGERQRRQTQNVQSENNDPLSAHAHVRLERFTRDGSNNNDGGLESTIQSQISAKYLQKQTAEMRASKAERLEEYHRSVQERLNRRIESEKAAERQRRASLPAKVQKLVYSKKEIQQFDDAGEDQPILPYAGDESTLVDVQAPPSNMTLDEFKAQGTPSKHVQERERESSPIGGFKKMSLDRPGTAPASGRRLNAAATGTNKSNVKLSKAESIAYLQQVRKIESARSRALVQTLRTSSSTTTTTSRVSDGRVTPRTIGTFGSSGLFPRDHHPNHVHPHDRPYGDERDLVALSRRHPSAFSVKQQLSSDEPQESERIVHVPIHSPTKAKAKMSRAVAGRVMKKKNGGTSVSGDGSGSTTNATTNTSSAYRRHLLERLHAIGQTLAHPLPPLCACGFTPKEEYELLFAYGGTTQTLPTAIPSSASQPQQQPPFNLSTIISSSTSSSSNDLLHPHHSHASSNSTTQVRPLPSHVSIDSTRHGFQHKHNCLYHQQPEGYVKALANLLHTLEDQQQI